MKHFIKDPVRLPLAATPTLRLRMAANGERQLHDSGLGANVCFSHQADIANGFCQVRK